jgi:hypothetical protein
MVCSYFAGDLQIGGYEITYNGNVVYEWLTNRAAKHK